MKRFIGFERGMGIGGWLTNYKRFHLLGNDKKKILTVGDFEHFQTYITEADVKNIAEMGFDHIRLGFDQVVVEDENGEYREDIFILIDNFISWCEKYSLNVVLNLHKAIGNYCDVAEDISLLDDESLQDGFVKLWLYIENRYSQNPKIVFELLNELTVGSAERWNEIAWREIIVNNIALWNSVSGGAQHPVTVYIDSISVQRKEVVETEKDLLLFNDEDSLAIVEKSYVNTANGFNAASIVTDGDRTVLSACFSAKSTGGYNSTLTIGIGSKYKASEIASIVITLRVPQLVGNAGNTYYKAGANVTASSSSSEISISSASVSNGTAKPTVTSDYITIPITGAQLTTALGSGDTIVNNIALWNSTSSGAQPVNVYIDSIVINLA